MIKTWQDRVRPNASLGEQHPVMQAEIDELRAALAKLKASNSFVRERTAALEQEWCAVRALQRAYQLSTLQDDGREGLGVHHVYCRVIGEDV